MPQRPVVPDRTVPVGDLMDIHEYLADPAIVRVLNHAIRRALRARAGLPLRVERVLVVDADRGERDRLVDEFYASGFEVAAAPDGRSALQVHSAEPVDLVVADLCAPEAGALELIQELRRRKATARVIALAPPGGAGTSEQLLRDARQVGADRTLCKPVESQRLLDAARELIEP